MNRETLPSTFMERKVVLEITRFPRPHTTWGRSTLAIDVTILVELLLYCRASSFASLSAGSRLALSPAGVSQFPGPPLPNGERRERATFGRWGFNATMMRGRSSNKR